MGKEEPISTDPGAIITESASFISSGKGESQVDSTYNDFFQETSDGTISTGPRVQKSGIEIFTTIFGYVIPIVMIIVLFSSLHVYIQKGGGAQAIKDNYTFLCPYLNYKIDGIQDEYSCETMQNIQTTYTSMQGELETKIINSLNEYIPIKLTKNILLTSPERKFAIQTFENKVKMTDIITQFESIVKESKSNGKDNIDCTGISIIGNKLTTQCKVSGSALGNDDENGKLGSARIELLRFIGKIADTSKSQFILLNPPTSLSMENFPNGDSNGFESSTTITIEAAYVSYTRSQKS